jgi:hypothetical protein
MSRGEHMPVGVVLERRRIDNPWQEHSWRAVAAIPGTPPGEPWRILAEGEDWVHYMAGTFEVELFPRETEGYRANLSQPVPALYVVIRPDEGEEEGSGGHEVVPFLVTACPYEAEGYVESGDELVEAVAMPDPIVAWVQDFVARHHVEVPFKKRKRKAYDPAKGDMGRGGGS